MTEPVEDPQPEVEVATTGGTVAITTYVPEYAWRCWTCGHVGLGLTSSSSAQQEADRHRCDPLLFAPGVTRAPV